jgi:hypothetical protein
MGGSIGGGGSSSNTSAQVSPEQVKQNQLTNQLLESYIPVLQNTLGGAGTVYGQTAPGVSSGAQNVINQAAGVQQTAGNAANNALGTANQWSNFATGLGAGSTAGATNAANILTTGGQQAGSFGAQALGSIFSPEYQAAQVKASLQPAMEAAREASGGQTAMFGGAGAAGSSREALANQNLNSLNLLRYGNYAANVQGNLENQKLGAASTLFNTGIGAVGQGGNLLGGLANTAVGVGNTANVTGALGNTLGNTGLNAATTGLTASTAPMSLFNQYASTVFVVPSNTTTANFTGAQGANTSSKGKGIKL